MGIFEVVVFLLDACLSCIIVICAFIRYFSISFFFFFFSHQIAKVVKALMHSDELAKAGYFVVLTGKLVDDERVAFEEHSASVILNNVFRTMA